MCVMTHKVEGCNSIHLVRQILPYLDRLFLAVATSENTTSNTISSSKNQHPLTSEGNNADLSLPKLYETATTTTTNNNSSIIVSNTGDAVSVVYLPHITFKWVKSTIHCLLRSPAPNIRRVIFERLLSSKLILQPTLETCEWLIYELFLNLTDNVSFFSTYYLDGSVNLGCQRAITEVFDYYKDHNSDPSVRTGGKEDALYIGGSYVSGIVFDDTSAIYEKKRHPGIPLPSFLARTMAVLHLTDKRDNSRLVEYFLINLLTVICDSNSGMHSLSAVKWILRPFCEVCVLILLPRCIYTIVLDRIKVFLRSRLACSNGIVRGHILSSLLPLIWRCVALQPHQQPTNTHTVPSTHATNTTTSTSDNSSTSEGSSRGNMHKDILTLLDLSVNYIGLDILLSTFLSSASPVSSNNGSCSDNNNSNSEQQQEEGKNGTASSNTIGLAYILYDTLTAAFSSTQSNTTTYNTTATAQSLYSQYTPKEVYLLSIATILLTCLTPAISPSPTTSTTTNQAQTESASPILLIYGGGDQLLSDARNLLNSTYMSCNKVMSILYYIRGIIHMQYYITKYKYINNINYTIYTIPNELLLALPDICTYIVSELNKMLTYSYTYAISGGGTSGAGNGTSSGLSYPTVSNATTSFVHDLETYDLLIEVLYGSLQLSIHYAYVDGNRKKNQVSANNRLQIIDSILSEINKLHSILMTGYDIHTTTSPTTTQHTNTTRTIPVHILTSLYIHAFNKAFLCLLHICDIYYTYIPYLIHHDTLKIGFQTLTMNIQNIAIKIGHNSDPLYTAREFKKYTERINIHDDNTNVTTTNNITTNNILLVHYINDSSIKQQYSRAADALVTNRFSALNSICSILQAMQCPSIAFLTSKPTTTSITMSTLDTLTTNPVTTTLETFSVPSSTAAVGGAAIARGGGALVGTAAAAAAVSLLETLLDQLDACSPMSVTPILVCCHHCIRALLSTLPSTIPTTTTTDSTTSTTRGDSDRKSGSGIHTLVERALSQAYRAALTTSEGADANAINAYIHMCFDPTLIEHMDADLLQVCIIHIYVT